MISFKRFWLVYFIIRIIYLIISIFVIQKFTSLGDTERYLNSGLAYRPNFLTSSSDFMDMTGGAIGYFLGGSSFLSNLPFTIYSFSIVNWAIRKVDLEHAVHPYLLLAILSLPSFCIWTSVFSKELFGLTVSAIFGVLFHRFFLGDFRLKFRDYLAVYICLVFKPQYLLFILQGLIFVYLSSKLGKQAYVKLFLALIMICFNVLVIYWFRDDIDLVAQAMHIHFFSYEASSNRYEHFFDSRYAVFKNAAFGMFIAFFGPSLTEMRTSFFQLIAGVESLFIIILFLYLISKYVFFNIGRGVVNIVTFSAYFLVITGICFVHYPFGIFNPGSAVRYRSNFLFLFILLFLHLYKVSTKYRSDYLRK